jgi:hypothetical protein
MSVNVEHLGLGIDSPVVTPAAANFRPPTWPPPPDFPVVLDAQSNVVSRYSDPQWDMSLWAGLPLTLNFGDGPQIKGRPSISPANANLLRQIAAWWLYGPKALRRPQTLINYFTLMRAPFILCTNAGITASNLTRFPAVADQLPNVLSPSGAETTLALLHAIYEERDQLGFTLLDRAGLARLEAALPTHEARQTPYIPPRIWTYQVNRIRAFLDDFHAHREGIEACFHFILDAYSRHSGSPSEASSGKSSPRGPFSEQETSNGGVKRPVLPFWMTAERFGIRELLERWCLDPGQSIEALSVRIFSTYCTMVSELGIAYLLNFSLMRIGEAWNLRADCLDTEQDDQFGLIYVLRGETTKTDPDSDARWVTSPSAKVAVDAMICVARLRMVCAKADADTSITDLEILNPYLVLRSHEPWVSGRCRTSMPLSVRPPYPSYVEVISAYPNLFDMEQLRITEADLQIARLINPDLDGNKFAVGMIWLLAWHQVRRTGAVNMQASGVVSDETLQYQLKHVTRAMALYYGQGYSRLALNDEARILYVRTIYEVLGKEFASLVSDRFASPYGDKRKSEILKLVDPTDHKKLTALARSGKVSWRETLLGGCTKRDPCPYGGVDNIAHCCGGNTGAPCVNVLYDREKLPELHQLSRVISSRMADALEGSPYRASLEAQQRALEKALDVIAR